MEHGCVPGGDSVEPVDTARAEILPDDAFVITGWPGVHQPIPPRGANMRGRARFEIEYIDFQRRAAWPVGMLHIKMTPRNLREKMHGPENDFRQKPIRVVEDN